MTENNILNSKISRIFLVKLEILGMMKYFWFSLSKWNWKGLSPLGTTKRHERNTKITNKIYYWWKFPLLHRGSASELVLYKSPKFASQPITNPKSEERSILLPFSRRNSEASLQINPRLGPGLLCWSFSST